MKLKYILGTVLTALFFVGCSDDDQTLGTFGDLNVSQSYLSIPENGGDMTVTVKAAQAWKFDEIFQKITKNDDGSRDTTYTALPDWLTADVLSGNAGETKVTFHADATSGGREAELQIVSAERTQFVVVRQGSMEASSATCAEVIAGNDGKTFRVKGTVTAIANTTYGNWYLDDGTGQIYIYGTLDAEGKTKNFLSLGIEVGDVVEVQGPKTTYNGTVELVDVTVLSITKSLVKVESAPVTVGKEGGDVEVKVSYKGSGALFAIPEADREWISLADSKYIAGDADTVVFRFHVAANEGAGRKSDLTFSSANKSASSEVTYTITQEANVLPHGMTADDPYTVAEAIAKCLEIGSTSDGEIYFAKGYIASISSIDTGTYGNATFMISDDGTEANALTCYRSYSLDNQKFTSEDEIAVGDEVIICGKLVNYKGTTPEFSGNVYIFSRKSAAEANQPGTLLNPFTPEQAVAYVDGGGTEAVYIKGIVSELYKGGFDPNYGNGSFYISDNGTKYGDPLKDFEAYQVNYIGNRKWTEADPQIAVGDEVVIYGPVTKYGDIRETKGKGAAYIYSLNGKTE